MRRVLIITIAFLNISTYVEAKQTGSRIVHFPKDRAVGRLKIRDAGPNNTIQSMLQILDWNLLDQAQGEIKVPAGKVLRLEIYEDVTDFSFLANLKPDDLQALWMRGDNVADEELVHLKNLTGLQALDLSHTLIQGDGLVHLSNLKSLRNLKFFNSQISDDSLEHLSALKSLTNLSLMYTQIDGSGLVHLKNLTSLVSLDISVTPITEDSLAHLAEMTSLKELVLYDTDIGDNGLAHLKSLNSLEELILGYLETTNEYSPITDEGLIYLKDLDSLKELWLVKTQITDAGFANLSNLRKLEVLFLSRTKLTGEGLAFLKEIPALKYLDFERTNIGDIGLANLKHWSDTLEGLRLEDTRISDTDLAHLADLKALDRLKLSNTSITDAGLVHIKQLNSLETLYLDNTYITDDGLMSLKNLPNLQNISVLETGVTNTGLEKFKQISASKSIKANYRSIGVSSKEKGLQLVGKEEPQIMGKPPSLSNKPLPELQTLNIEIPPADTEGKMILVCFFDMQQRPSRHCINQLAKQAEKLKQKGVTVVAVQASQIDDNKLNDWIKKYQIPFHIGMIEGDQEKIRFNWGVKSLPWLILTDKNHIVQAEGFNLSELDEKLTRTINVKNTIHESISKSSKPAAHKPNHQKSFMDAVEILKTWEDNYAHFNSMQVSYTHRVLEAKPPAENPHRYDNLVKIMHVERVEQGDRFHIRYSTAEEGFAQPESIIEGSFDGEITREHFGSSKSGMIIKGMIGRNTETMNRLKNYMLLTKRLLRKSNNTKSFNMYWVEDLNSKTELSHILGAVVLKSKVLVVSVLPELESVAGQLCHVLETKFRENKDRKIWFAHEKGMIPLKYQRFRNNEVVFEIEVEQIDSVKTDKGDIWFPKKAYQNSNYQNMGGIKYELTVHKFVPNIKVDENTFYFDFPKGTHISDRIRGIWGVDLPKEPPSLIGKPLPNLQDLKIDLSSLDSNKKMLLICFFDMQQRPSRYSLRQLSKRAQEIKTKDIFVVAVQASKIEDNKLNDWVKKYKIPFAVGAITADIEKIRFTWGIKSLPWLILTDKNHIVKAEGFTLSELNDKIKEVAP